MTIDPSDSERKELIRDFAQVLVKTKALQFGSFTLTSGKKSPYYVDLRIIPSVPEMFKRLVGELTRITKSTDIEGFDVIVGVPTSGLVYATAIAYELGKPLVYVRKGKRIHGTKRDVEGIITSRERVLMIDDLTTTGKSLIDTALKMRELGCSVKSCIAIIDRREGALENLRKNGIELIALTSTTEIMDVLQRVDDSTS